MTPEAPLEKTVPTTRAILELNNRAATPMEIELAQLRPEMEFDCSLVSSYRPYIPRSAFAGTTTVVVAQGDKHKLEFELGSDCQLVHVTNGKGAGIVLLRPKVEIRVDLYEESFSPRSGNGWFLGVEPDSVESLAACEQPLPSLDWSSPMPVGDEVSVSSVEHSVGCTRLALAAGSAGTFSWRVCAGAPLPIERGDRISISLQEDANGKTVTIVQKGGKVERTIVLGKQKIAGYRNFGTKPTFTSRSLYQPSARPTCIAKSECEAAWLPASYNVQFGTNRLSLGSGDHAALKDTPTRVALEARVVRARARFVAPRGCFADETPVSEIDTVTIRSAPASVAAKKVAE